MDPINITRFVYEGHDPSDTWIIKGIGHSKINFDNVNVVKLTTLSEYESGCQMHPSDNCSGHLCETVHRMKLPMQSLAVNTPVIKNDIYKSAVAAFRDSSEYSTKQHKDILMESMKGKHGRQRKGIVNCHIDGSIRMVIIPQTFSMHHIAVPYYLASTWTVMYLDKQTNTYLSRYVKHGDYCLGIRAPTLGPWAIQAMRITFWNKTAMGLPLDILPEFNADFDGDEFHVMPIYSEIGIEECKRWVKKRNDAFEEARSLYYTSKIPNKKYGLYDFMTHTSMSFEEIRLNKEQPICAEQTRTKSEHIDAFSKRYNTLQVESQFVDEAIRGMGDTNMQQLSQPIVGDLSRIAKLASGCVIHKPDNVLGIATESSFVPITTYDQDTQSGGLGGACLRGLSRICSASQQALLQAHHASKQDFPAHDIIKDIVDGSDETIIFINVSLPESRIRKALRPRWIDTVDHITYVLCKVENIVSLPKGYIKGSYNPQVLSKVDSGSRLEVCKFGIEMLCKYNGFPISSTEIISIAVLYSYEVSKSQKPITTRDGMIARKLRWTEVVMATHYYGLTERLKEQDIPVVPVETVSSCLMAANFTNI